jgi:hypothetical protein
MAVTLNSVAVYPSDIQLTTRKIGVSLVMASGARVWVDRLDGVDPIAKRQWELTWDGATAAVRTIVAAAFALSAPFAFVDQYGGSYTVQCEDDGYQESVNLIAGDGTLYYDLSLTVFET